MTRFRGIAFAWHCSRMALLSSVGPTRGRGGRRFVPQTGQSNPKQPNLMWITAVCAAAKRSSSAGHDAVAPTGPRLNMLRACGQAPWSRQPVVNSGVMIGARAPLLSHLGAMAAASEQSGWLEGVDQGALAFLLYGTSGGQRGYALTACGATEGPVAHAPCWRHGHVSGEYRSVRADGGGTIAITRVPARGLAVPIVHQYNRERHVQDLNRSARPRHTHRRSPRLANASAAL